MDPIETERWDTWVDKQLADPNSCFRQLMSRGISLDAALITVMLQRNYDELLDIERSLEIPKDDWER